MRKDAVDELTLEFEEEKSPYLEKSTEKFRRYEKKVILTRQEGGKKIPSPSVTAFGRKENGDLSNQITRSHVYCSLRGKYGQTAMPRIERKSELLPPLSVSARKEGAPVGIHGSIN